MTTAPDDDRTSAPQMERATLENFFEDGYVAANQDVAATVRQRSGDGFAHFMKYGKHEVRLQYTRSGLAALRQAKFEFFCGHPRSGRI